MRPLDAQEICSFSVLMAHDPIDNLGKGTRHNMLVKVECSCGNVRYCRPIWGREERGRSPWSFPRCDSALCRGPMALRSLPGSRCVPILVLPNVIRSAQTLLDIAKPVWWEGYSGAGKARWFDAAPVDVVVANRTILAIARTRRRSRTFGRRAILCILVSG
ncbi:hypothetical protein FJ543_23610 [Mesorhizobium sp. B2-5-7]|nr:hypothetical protein FJ543_23610 [Mesorhizobium sp. B2-5-7]